MAKLQVKKSLHQRFLTRVFSIYYKIKYDYFVALAIVKMQFGIPSPLVKEDRRILEKIVLPYFAENQDFNRILFIGCEYYTWHYKKLFNSKEYWTIEPKRLNSLFGAKRHIRGLMNQIDRYFENGSFDAIVCNGVIGFGLNALAEIENSLEKCFLCLRDGGVLVIGWNDIRERTPFQLENCQSLQKLKPLIFPPLSSSKYLTNTDNRHTFSFYAKPGSSD